MQIESLQGRTWRWRGGYRNGRCGLRGRSIRRAISRSGRILGQQSRRTNGHWLRGLTLHNSGRGRLRRVEQEPRREQSHAKSDGQQNCGAPGRARRDPTGRKENSERARNPAAIFFAIERVLQSGAATSQQCGIGFGMPGSEQHERLLFSRKIGRAGSALGEMSRKTRLFGWIQFTARSGEREQWAPVLAGFANLALPPVEFSMFAHAIGFQTFMRLSCAFAPVISGPRPIAHATF